MIVNADALRVPLGPQSVHMVACSPPYWGLRSYATGAYKVRELGAETLHDCLAWARDAEPCGACFVCNMRSVARELWRVLRDGGVWWLNLGDSYASNPASGGAQSAKMTGGGHKRTPQGGDWMRPDGLKPKDLAGVPWRVALALQADGWYLRSDIVWAKPNPIPESVTDRPTKAHEYVFLLTKSARYHYDAEAVKEAGTGRETYFGSERYSAESGRNDSGSYDASQCATRNRRTVWTIATQPYPGAHYAVWPPALVEPMILAGSRVGDIVLDPFCGSGTTGMVARLHGRRFVGLDLSMVYLHDQALARAEGLTPPESIAELPMFSGVTA